MAAAMSNHALKALSGDYGLQRRAACSNLMRRQFSGLPRVKTDVVAAFKDGCCSCLLWSRPFRYHSISTQGLAGSGKLRRGVQVLCLTDSSREEVRTSVSDEDEVRLKDANGRGPTKAGVTQSVGEMNSFGSNGNTGPRENLPSRPDEKQDDVALVEQDAAVRTVVFWVGAAAAFGTLLFFNQGSSKASEFFAGYLLEQSLSVDNLFVFVVIFNYFKTPPDFQSRVLTYGIAGAVLFRGLMITLGAATLQRFEAVNLFFAAILFFSAYKLFQDSESDDDDLSDNFIVNLCKRFIPVTSTYDGDKFFTVQDGIRKATPLLLTLTVVELSDVAFAVDSIPAVFGVTRDPLIVFSSNIFAILGLRSLYTLISGSMAELEYLQPSVAGVLTFIGCKMVVEYFGLHISTEASLGVVAVLLGSGIGLSILAPSKDDEDDEES